ncbi:MAG: elongation factor G [Clostridiales bacterium]|nr:elongation factor G [Clostridiales bacterium]
MNVYSLKDVRNVAVLGHSGCGKTTVCEAVLFQNGVTKRFGKVESGNTVSDYDAEEIRRKVSINTSVIPVEVDGKKINLLDTPGYFDFVGEVKEALAVADVALIVVSAKSGVEVGTEKSWELAEEMGVSRMILINGMDDENADYHKVVEQLEEKFGKSIAPLHAPYIENGKFVGFINVIKREGRKFNGDKVEDCGVPDSLEDDVEEARSLVMEAVAETSEELMEKFFEEEEFTEDEIYGGIKTGILDGSVTPVLCASATKEIGTYVLLRQILKYIPSTNELKPTIPVVNSDGEESEVEVKEDAPFSAFVFKTIADPYIGRLSIFKVRTGVLKKDMAIRNINKGTNEKAGHIYVIRGKEQIEVNEVRAGDIAALAKLSNTATCDTLADPKFGFEYKPIDFPKPYQKKSVSPLAKGDEDKMASAISKMLEEDKTLLFEVDKDTKESVISGIGDTHLDVFVKKLKAKYKLDVVLGEPKIAYKEKIRAAVTHRHKYKKQSGGSGQYGDVQIDFSPNFDNPEEPYVFEEKVFGGSVPKQYFPAVEKGIHESVKKGPLAGYPVVGIKAVLTDGSYHAVDSNKNAFKTATMMCFKEAFLKAKPTILEPIMNVEVTVPKDYTGDIMDDMNKRRGRVNGMESSHGGKQKILAQAPLSEMSSYATDLRSMTQGRGDFTMELSGYEEAPQDVCNKVIEAAKAQ